MIVICETMVLANNHSFFFFFPSSLNRIIRIHIKEFRDVQKHPLRQPVPREVIKWSPPAESVYKVNFDRAVFEDQACAGLGVVVKDSAGLIIGALSQKIKFPGSVVMVEALAARRAVLFAKEISVFRVVVEGGFSAGNQGCQFRKAVQDSIWAYY